LQVRAPAWAATSTTFELNGKKLNTSGAPGSYAKIERRWKKGDRLVVTIPMAVRAESLRGSPNQVAFLYGPAVLAGDLGPAARSETVPYAKDQAANLKAESVDAPVLASDPARAASAVHRDADSKELVFRTQGIGQPNDVVLRPFYELPYQRYNVYWTLVDAK
jgi:DUF1680 family protein